MGFVFCGAIKVMTIQYRISLTFLCPQAVLGASVCARQVEFHYLCDDSYQETLSGGGALVFVASSGPASHICGCSHSMRSMRGGLIFQSGALAGGTLQPVSHKHDQA